MKFIRQNEMYNMQRNRKTHKHTHTHISKWNSSSIRSYTCLMSGCNDIDILNVNLIRIGWNGMWSKIHRNGYRMARRLFMRRFRMKCMWNERKINGHGYVMCSRWMKNKDRYLSIWWKARRTIVDGELVEARWIVGIRCRRRRRKIFRRHFEIFSCRYNWEKKTDYSPNWKVSSLTNRRDFLMQVLVLW